MNPDRWAAIEARTQQAEGRTSWLYRDSSRPGNITCGVGHLVPDRAHAQALPFVPAITQQEWCNLLCAPIGTLAATYQIDTKGRLSEAAIDALLRADLEAALADLRAKWPRFDAFPQGAQEALLDMGFNLGVPRFLVLFPRLVCAVGSGDWQACALECHRSGISAARNEMTAALFTEGL
jgi:GH24 family phage-related lysozyme (muramidase)